MNNKKSYQQRLYDLWNWIENWLARASYRKLSYKREQQIRKKQNRIEKRYCNYK